jgi:hypothetical protein
MNHVLTVGILGVIAVGIIWPFIGMALLTVLVAVIIYTTVYLIVVAARNS